MQRTISVIGCGWLGLPLGALLVEKGFRVKGSTTRKERLPDLEARGIKAFRVRADLELEGENLDDFFQSGILIINIPPGRRRPDVKTVHPLEIKNILDQAEQSGIEQVLFVGSTAVYGNNNGVVTEGTATAPVTPSGSALVRIEQDIRSRKHFQYTVLRMAGLVGGDRKAGRFLAGKKNIPNGDAPVNLIHREDAIRVIYEVIRQKAWNEVFNVCTDLHPSRKMFYTLQAEKQGFEKPEFETGGKVSFKIVSNEKLKNRLNYHFLFPDPMQF